MEKIVADPFQEMSGRNYMVQPLTGSIINVKFHARKKESYENNIQSWYKAVLS